jgi:ATP-dependent Clp protease ATP-binding subunit ClpC
MRDKILGESKRAFKPEFLNRLDDMIVFHQLARNDLVKIVDLEVAKVIERVRAKDIRVHLDPTAVEFLIDKGYDPTYGARPMRRAVEKYLEDPLAEVERRLVSAAPCELSRKRPLRTGHCR